MGLSRDTFLGWIVTKVLPWYEVPIVAVKCAATSCLTALTRKTGSDVKMLNNLYMNWVHVTSFHLTCQQQRGITMRPVIHRNKSPDWFSKTQCSGTLWLNTYVWPMQLVLSPVRITRLIFWNSMLPDTRWSGTDRSNWCGHPTERTCISLWRGDSAKLPLQSIISRYRDAFPLLRTPLLELNAV